MRVVCALFKSCGSFFTLLQEMVRKAIAMFLCLGLEYIQRQRNEMLDRYIEKELIVEEIHSDLKGNLP